MEECLIFWLVVDFQHPAILVTLKSDDERFVVINAGPFTSKSLRLLSDVLKDAPPTYHVSLYINQNVERFVQTLGLVDHL